MKLEKVINDSKELCFLLNPQDTAEKEFLEMVDANKAIVQWHDGRIGLKTRFKLEATP